MPAAGRDGGLPGAQAAGYRAIAITALRARDRSFRWPRMRRRCPERFGFDEVVTLFNMSEMSAPIVSERKPDRVRGSCGKRAGRRGGAHRRRATTAKCRIGEMGELMVRSRHAVDDVARLSPQCRRRRRAPGATAGSIPATRSGRDADGNFFFVDRVKDAIRRRGENISSFEVEGGDPGRIPRVLEAAAVAVPSELGEDEVLAVVVPKPGRPNRSAWRWCISCGRGCRTFMVPRYIRIVDALPKTPTSKVEKHRLRAEGVTADTWDREAAGLRLKRERLSG